ncbi:hypothetical protein Q5H91_05560 [Sphingomonas sp. KR1UV-12]|uniref:DUF4402 domain-containing protein n=1 Tax=Sphingomonas aurea TaxID=3063994 RepID=A0ABT9EI78_9SPHN|nr:hypothetical protein [Sphingomonas sp. KR1UV-12]MDP1026669.1 hypothetical protein [Sphingomonas sp. KR1UV-12]
MIALLAAALQGLTPPPVASWRDLPVFPLSRTTAPDEGSAFVKAEIAAGRCSVPPEGSDLVAPIAILVGPTGAIRQIVPQAIGCPTVEQYTVGYLMTLTRAAPGSTPPRAGWYSLAIEYHW